MAQRRRQFYEAWRVRLRQLNGDELLYVVDGEVELELIGRPD
jgi:hypothetical protein